ncbi:WGR domain-containing protein [Ciceribacter sp. L1K23]|uniref:WGR domain-containing protein n=1 Tax=Ciceribacter sp. L1K23 TaxID=2820276 RepID=UPI001B84474B|nr:WGR domain-containing protein [Ciceribacter sp. L1K23]MBR0554307.1 WGR domain-containing protein [Ciceribacter sp. L1K23]
MTRALITHYAERTDVTRNMARFYALEIVPTLFGETCLTRRWGRIGRRGQSKAHTFETEEAAANLFREIVKRKQARGYRVPTGADVAPVKAANRSRPETT